VGVGVQTDTTIGNGGGYSVRVRSGDVSAGPLPPQFAAPDLPSSFVQVPRLSRLLDAAARGPVTLLAAPAGWGKTVAASAWLKGGGARGPMAWLTLEPGDERERFWSRLSSALATVGIPEARNCTAPEAEDRARQLADLINDLREPVLVVLDDFHVVDDPSAMNGLDLLVRHTRGRLRLLIAARADPALPLHRWRLRGELTEVREDDLALTIEETAQLLARHDLALPTADVRALHARTEGWPAGLRLAALSMQGHPDTARVMEEFSGELDSVAQYLNAEIFQAQPAQIQDLLLCTSAVDRVCGDLADALTGRDDGEQRLADLRHTNVFLVPLGGRPAWYRYHHLFGEMLRANLRRHASDRISELHRRAADWYTTHGLPIAAVRHALAGDDPRLTRALLREHWPDLALCGCHERPQRPRASISDDVPTSADAELTLAYAADRLDVNDLDEADHLLWSAARRHDESTALMAAALRLARARLGDDIDSVAFAAGQLLDLVEQAETGAEMLDDDSDRCAAARTVALTALGLAQLGVGDLEAAQDALLDGVSAAAQAGPQCARISCTGGLALLRAVRGELHSADQTARAALAMSPCRGQSTSVHSESAYLALAIVHHERDEPAEAVRYLDLAVRGRDLAGDTMLASWVTIIRAWLLTATDDLTGAHDTLAGARGALGEAFSPHLQRWFAAAEAELRIACGAAHTVSATLTPLLEDAQATFTPVAVALAHSYLRDGDPHAAARALPHWSDDTKAEPFLSLRLDAGLVEAVSARRVGDARRAATTLERVLQLAEPDGHRRAFSAGGSPVRELLTEQLEFGTAYWSLVTELVESPTRRPDAQDRNVTRPKEQLTDRELTVLRYLQSILSNEEIASKLFVSVNTVKTHVRNIYRKLDVARRREAVRRARELGLL